MQPGKYQGNRILAQKWDQKDLNIHNYKLQHMKPTIDSSCPATYRIPKRKSKKEQLSLERNTAIDRENRKLVEKMSSIILDKSQKARNQSHQIKSLNKNSRRQKLIQIAIENEAILKRIQERKPHYSLDGFKKDRQRMMKVVKNMCLYPYNLKQAEKKHKQAERQSRAQVQRDTKNLELAHLNLSIQLVLSQRISINEQEYDIEIYKGSQGILISADNSAKTEHYSIGITFEEARELIGKVDNYEAILRCISIIGEGLVLLNPRINNQSITSTGLIHDSSQQLPEVNEEAAMQDQEKIT